MTTSEREVFNHGSSNLQQDNCPLLSTSAATSVDVPPLEIEGSSAPPTNASFSESPTNSKLSKSAPTYPTYPPRNEDIIKGSFWSRLSSGAKRSFAQNVGLQLSERLDRNQDKRVMKDFVFF